MINPTIFTFTAIKTAVMNRVKSFHAGSRWLDYFDTSIGTIIIELVAGLETVMKKTVAAYRRESFLFTATSPTSVISIAQGVNGYSAHRGQNPYWNIVVTFSISKSVSPFTVIGSMGGFNVIYIGVEQAINAGVPVTLLCTFGTITQETITAPSASIQNFRFSTPFSNTTRLKLTQANITNIPNNPGTLGGLVDPLTGVTLAGQPTPNALTQANPSPPTPHPDLPDPITGVGGSIPNPVAYDTQIIPSSPDFINMVSQSYLAITNLNWSVDVMYLNQQKIYDPFDSTIVAVNEFSNLYNLGDKLTVEGVSLENISIDLTKVKITNGVVDLVSSYQFSPYLPRETTNSIAIKSSIYHETQSVLRGRADQSKRLLTMNPQFIMTNYTDIAPTQLNLTYSMVNDSYLTPSQNAQYINDLMTFSTMGILPPLLTDPVIEFLTLNITVYKQTNSVLDGVSLEGSLRGLWAKYERMLSSPFDPIPLESDAVLNDPNIMQLRITSATLQPKATVDASLQASDISRGAATSTRGNNSSVNSTVATPISADTLPTAEGLDWWRTYYIFSTYNLTII